jgi:hypothetical protein
VAVFRGRDPLTARMMQQLLAGVSMRHYEDSLRVITMGVFGATSRTATATLLTVTRNTSTLR